MLVAYYKDDQRVVVTLDYHEAWRLASFLTSHLGVQVMPQAVRDQLREALELLLK